MKYGIYVMYPVQTGPDEFDMEIDHALEEGFDTWSEAKDAIESLEMTRDQKRFLKVLSYEP